MSEPIRLTEDQASDLGEIGNVGTGYAASGLADQVGTRCVIGLPQIAVLNAASAGERLGSSDAFAAAVSARLTGDFEASMVVIMTTRSADAVIERMAQAAAQLTGTWVDMPRESALKQLGGKMMSGYAHGVDGFLKVRSQLSPTELTVDLWSSALKKIFGELLKREGDQILIQSSFVSQEHGFEGMFAYVLGSAAVRFVLDRTRGMVKA